jgi:hypothetical protein
MAEPRAELLSMWKGLPAAIYSSRRDRPGRIVSSARSLKTISAVRSVVEILKPPDGYKVSSAADVGEPLGRSK